MLMMEIVSFGFSIQLDDVFFFFIECLDILLYEVSLSIGMLFIYMCIVLLYKIQIFFKFFF